MDVRAFVEKWSPSGAAEHSNSQSFLNDLCDLLGVERPNPATGDAKLDRYVFERPVLLAKEGNASIGHVDLFKDGHFILEAKQGSHLGTKRIGTARRGTAAWNIAMKDAYGQALGYAKTLDEPPPFIVTTDIGHCFDLYAAFDAAWDYRAFPNARTNRIYLSALLDPELGPKHIDTLRSVFTDPRSLDPSHLAVKVTREVAAHLAELARTLEEDERHPPERVARFLMRCIFTMFAEDVGLLPGGLFARLIKEHWLPNPPAFPGGIRSLWKTMNEGGEFVLGKLLQFNGGLFKDPDALPLKTEHLLRLQEAATCDWSEVEPAIFGTLLERALDAHERHALGAHYTPRAYVERLVRPTIEEPMRAEWDLVRAEVRQLVEAGKEQQAKKSVRAFYDKLTHTRVLDPACGTGNFLYVTLDLFKRLEAEVVALLGELEEKQMLGEDAGYGVTPQQFLGIEVKPWAKEIAELVLWIGYLQWHFRTRGRVNPPEPVLRDYGNIELRDAVLTYDRVELVRDDSGRPVSRWDGRTYKESPVTGERIPDEEARVPLYRYVGARKATWPKADFIVGNPPFVGNKRMRAALGDGYVEALRGVHDDVPETCDFVMYWWNTAAHIVRSGAARRFGLITTNSITQTFSRKVLDNHLRADPALSLLFAIPDHPWVDSEDGAAVRIAMTVGECGATDGRVATVVSEEDTGTGEVKATVSTKYGRVNSSLSVGPDFGAVRALRSNAALSFMGVTLIGEGFRLDEEALRELRLAPSRLPSFVRPYIMGRDLAGTPASRWVIDFFGLSEDEARRRGTAAYQWVLDRVKPERAQNPRKAYRDRWWVLGEPREGMRAAIRGLERYVATARTAKYRAFQFVRGGALVDSNVIAVATDDAFVLAVLSSRLHVAWALRCGATLEDRPHYTSSTVFEPFPFPLCSEAARDRIRRAGEALDAHRKARQQEHSDLSFTEMYNVLAKLRTGEALTAKEKGIHQRGMISVLRELHDEVDTATFDAYGWPDSLTDEQVAERLVALNSARAEEEARGTTRWIRPEFQNPQGAQRAATQVALIGGEAAAAAEAAPSAAAWPSKLHERIAAVRAALARGRSLTTAEVAKTFKRAKRAEVEEVLTTLSALGLAVSFETAGLRRWRAAGRLAAA